MKFGIVVFPGSNCDEDAFHAARDVFGQEAEYLWHKDADLKGADAVILPGGFAHGDYLRTGAMARFSPIMAAIRAFAGRGGPVLGICNGFQILCEAGLLPGALIRNRGLSFVCRWVNLRTERSGSTGPSGGLTDWQDGEILQVPIKHGEGQFVASEEELAGIEANGQVVLRYCSPAGRIDETFNPNGAAHNIAGVRNERGNVIGMMPHPEHAVDADLGPTGGLFVLGWLLEAARRRVAV